MSPKATRRRVARVRETPEAGLREKRRRRLPLNIFLSHKMADVDRARDLSQALCDHGGMGLRVFLSPNIQVGNDWSEVVHKELSTADWLVLLYTDPEQAWDWCLYEAGFFAARDDPDRRIICLHRPGDRPPNPFRRWKPVEATVDSVMNLLRQIFADGEECWGVAPHFALNTLGMQRLAQRIVDIVGPAVSEEKTFTARLCVRVSAAQLDELDRGRIPDEATVECDARALLLFGVRARSGVLTWGDFVRDAHTSQRRWLEYLGQVPRRAARPGFVPMLPLFRSRETARAYRPVLTQIETLPKRWMRFHVIFAEVHASTDRDAKDMLDRVYHILTLTRIFRRGLFQRYEREVVGLADASGREDDKQRLLDEIRAELNHIIVESQNRGVEFLTDAVAAFDKPDQERLVELVQQDWVKAHGQLMQAANIREANNALAGMRRVCDEFTRIAGRRYAELVQAL